MAHALESLARLTRVPGRSSWLRLAERYHVIAPDYPGFGYSSAPASDKFDYTFDKLAEVIEKFRHYGRSARRDGGA